MYVGWQRVSGLAKRIKGKKDKLFVFILPVPFGTGPLKNYRERKTLSNLPVISRSPLMRDAQHLEAEGVLLTSLLTRGAGRDGLCNCTAELYA